MRLFKMQSCGNVYYYTCEKKPSDFFIKKVCKQGKTDGLVTIYKTINGYGFKIYNRDASIASFCGNACMCVARYLFDQGKVTKNVFYITTDCGDKKAIIFNEQKHIKVGLEVGKPHFCSLNGAKSNTPKMLCVSSGCGKFIKGYLVDVGNLHFVMLNGVGGQNICDYENAVKTLNASGVFKNGVNAHFVSLKNNAVQNIVYERGSGRTLSCGSGAAAVFFVLNKLNFVKEYAEIRFEGGNIAVEKINDEVYIKGKPEYLPVFEKICVKEIDLCE